jgi:DNA polymerase III epsilon subunit-like protein
MHIYKFICRENGIYSKRVYINDRLRAKQFVLSDIKLFIDVESTGFPRCGGYSNPSQVKLYNSARVIEIGYVICNGIGDVIKQYSTLIKPVGFCIRNTHIHGITYNRAKNKGIDIRDAIKQLHIDLCMVDTIVAHNAKFDVNIILSECYRARKTKLIKCIRNKNVICTMKMGRDLLTCRYPPKLCDLYENLHNIKLTPRHRALFDATVCKDCYFKMCL